MTYRSMRAAIAGLTVHLLYAGHALAGPVADPIPEPAGFALLALGVGAVAWVKFRRRK
jgi:hypothetical protein